MSAEMNWSAAETPPEPGFLETLYEVLFHPVRSFHTIAEAIQAGQGQNRRLFFAALSVILISAIAPMVHFSAQGGNVLNLVVFIPLLTVGGLLCWLFTGLVVGLLAYAFTGETRIKLFLTLSGLATLPWLLMAPMVLFKLGLGMVGSFMVVVSGLLIWLWAVLLFALALIVTYRMTAERAMAVLVMPFLALLVLGGWIWGFIVNIGQLMPR